MSAFSALKRAPLRTVSLLPSAFSDSWPDRPHEAVTVGLRLLSQADMDQARARAAEHAVEMHNEADDQVASYNDALMGWAVSCALCAADDVTADWIECAQDNVPEALTPEAIRYVFHELERLHVTESPIVAQATNEEIAALAQALRGEAVDALPAQKQAQVRRLVTALAELLA